MAAGNRLWWRIRLHPGPRRSGTCGWVEVRLRRNACTVPMARGRSKRGELHARSVSTQCSSCVCVPVSSSLSLHRDPLTPLRNRITGATQVRSLGTKIVPVAALMASITICPAIRQRCACVSRMSSQQPPASKTRQTATLLLDSASMPMRYVAPQLCIPCPCARY